MNGPNPDPNDDFKGIVATEATKNFKGTSSPGDLGFALVKTLLKMWAIWACVVLALAGVGVYIVVHFLAKFW